tara:strand:- start:4734 stop:5420 length:687 start_codon:yes stop_codon:yes gene_type:complete
MAERAPINPFANLKPDATLSRMATDSNNNVANLLQSLGVQRSKNAAAMARNKADNLAKRFGHRLQYNIPSNLSPVQLDKLLQDRSNDARMDTRARIGVNAYKIGKMSPLLPNDNLLKYYLSNRRIGNVVPMGQADAAAGKETTKTEKIVDDPSGQASGGKMKVSGSSSSKPDLGPPKITFPTSKKAPSSKKTQQSSDKKTTRKWGTHKDGRSGTWELNPATGGWKFMG